MTDKGKVRRYHAAEYAEVVQASRKAAEEAAAQKVLLQEQAERLENERRCGATIDTFDELLNRPGLGPWVGIDHESIELGREDSFNAKTANMIVLRLRMRGFDCTKQANSTQAGFIVRVRNPEKHLLSADEVKAAAAEVRKYVNGGPREGYGD